MGRIVLDSDDEGEGGEVNDPQTVHQPNNAIDNSKDVAVSENPTSSEKLQGQIQIAQLALLEPTPSGKHHDPERHDTISKSSSPMGIGNNDSGEASSSARGAMEPSPNDTLMDTPSHPSVSTSHLTIEVPTGESRTADTEHVNSARDDGRPPISPLSDKDGEDYEEDALNTETHEPVVLVRSKRQRSEAPESMLETKSGRKQKFRDASPVVEDASREHLAVPEKPSSRSSKRRKLNEQVDTSTSTEKLCEMGFSESAAVNALNEAEWNFDKAVEALLGDSGAQEIQMDRQTESQSSKSQGATNDQPEDVVRGEINVLPDQSELHESNESALTEGKDRANQQVTKTITETRRTRGRPRKSNTRSVQNTDLDNGDEATDVIEDTAKKDEAEEGIALQSPKRKSSKKKRRGRPKSTKLVEDDEDQTGKQDAITEMALVDEEDLQLHVDPQTPQVLTGANVNVATSEDFAERKENKDTENDFKVDNTGEEVVERVNTEKVYNEEQKENANPAIPQKETPEQKPKMLGSSMNAGKVPLKVGLSKRAHIEPLLRVIKK